MGLTNPWRVIHVFWQVTISVLPSPIGRILGALLCVEASQRRPWVIDDQVEPRQTVTPTLSLDNRIEDGGQAARLLAAFETFMRSSVAL